MTTTAGGLQRKILIEKKSVTRDAVYGSELVAWVPLSTVSGQPEWYWAEVQDVLPSRNESVTKGLPLGRNTTRIRMRWRADIDSTMRVKLRGDAANVVLQIIGGPAEIEGRK